MMEQVEVLHRRREAESVEPLILVAKKVEATRCSTRSVETHMRQL